MLFLMEPTKKVFILKWMFRLVFHHERFDSGTNAVRTAVLFHMVLCHLSHKTINRLFWFILLGVYLICERADFEYVCSHESVQYVEWFTENCYFLFVIFRFKLKIDVISYINRESRIGSITFLPLFFLWSKILKYGKQLVAPRQYWILMIKLE